MPWQWDETASGIARTERRPLRGARVFMSKDGAKLRFPRAFKHLAVEPRSAPGRAPVKPSLPGDIHLRFIPQPIVL